MANYDAIIQELNNSQKSNTILTGALSGIERLRDEIIVALVDYKGFSVTIPLKEMMVELKRPDGQSNDKYNERCIRILNKMLGADIDFIICGVDEEEKAAVGSRRTAMLQKRHHNFLDDKPHIYAGCAAEARIIAVSQMSVRVEVCGVEATVKIQHLSWGYLDDARDVYNVGDSMQVKVTQVYGETVEDIRIAVDVRSLSADSNRDNLDALKLQSNYIGTVNGAKDRAIFVNLVNGAWGIAFKCMDSRKPVKGDKVVFIPTRKDHKGGVAIGLISRIVNKGR